MRCSGFLSPALSTSLLFSFAACGASAGRTSTIEDTRVGAVVDSDEASVGARNADVPRADAAREDLIFVRAGSIWTMGPDGEAAEQLSLRSDEAPDQTPTVSPDGNLLVYASEREGTSHLFAMEIDTLLPEVLVEGPASHPRFSPDGRYLYYYHGDARERRDLYRLNLETGNPELLLEGNDDHPDLGGAAVPTPDGKAVIVAADRREHHGVALWRLDLASKRLARITPQSDRSWARDVSPSLSPNGKRIVFASNRHGNDNADAEDYDVYTIGIDGSGLLRLTEDPGAVADPVFSLDGKRIYFASTRVRTHGFEWEVFVMASQGGVQKRLTRDAQPQNRSPRPRRRPSTR